MIDTLIGICLFAIVITAAIASSECDLPKTPRYWLRILFEKKGEDNYR